MLRFKISKKEIITPLQMVVGVVERKHSIAVLGNVLIKAQKKEIIFTATDTDIEMKASVSASDTEFLVEGEVTVPARKLLDICKSLENDITIEFEQKDPQIIMTAGGVSRYVLSTLPADSFPHIEKFSGMSSIKIKQNDLRVAINKTSFAMPSHDVRHYLNGTLFEINNSKIRLVATDAHRLALYDIDSSAKESDTFCQMLIPRKAILELARLLNSENDFIEIFIGDKYFRAKTEKFTFTSKLIDAAFPDYKIVIPKDSRNKKRLTVTVNREEFKSSLHRMAILTSDKLRGVQLFIKKDKMKLTAKNPDQEQAEETIKINICEEELNVGFNVFYLLDVLSVLSGETVTVKITDSKNSATIEDEQNPSALYVVMPMIL